MARKQKKPLRKKRQTRAKPGKSRIFYKRWPFQLIAILVLVFVVLSPLLTADFVDIDDKKLILDKQYVFQSDPAGILELSLFTPHYKPVVYFTWMVEYFLSGNAAWMHHLNNLLLHLLNCFLIFFFARKIGDKFEFTKGFAIPLGLFTALFFGIHPLHVESVAWVVERKDVLYTAFFLLSLLAYIKYVEDPKRKWLGLSALGFLISVFSKSPAVTLPFFLFLIDYTYGRKWGLHLLREKVAHFGVLLLALYAFGFFSLGTSEGSIGAIAEQTIISTSPYVRDLPTLYAKLLIASMKGVLWYLHSWLPFRLALAYPRESIIGFFGVGIHLFPWILGASLLFLFLRRKKWPFLFFTHAFFFLAMLPAMIRVAPGIGIFLNDRYVYFALAGLILLFVALVLNLKNRILAYGLLGLVGILCSFSSYRVALDWRNTESLWTRVIDNFPEVEYAYTNRGAYYRERGEIGMAMEDLNKAISLKANANNLNQRGVVLRQMGKYEEAILDYNRAIQDDPGNFQAWLNRGNAYLEMARFERAKEDFDKAVELNPTEVKIWSSRGVAHAQLRQFDAAEADFRKAEMLNPTFPEVYSNRGLMYFQKGNKQQALSDFMQYSRLRPGDHQMIFDIGNIYQSIGNHAKAVEFYSKAISMNPQAMYFQRRANSYETLGKTEQAARDRLMAAEQ